MSDANGGQPPLGQRIFQYVMTEYRSLVVVVMALPLSMRPSR